MKKRISVLFAATILILTIVVEPAFAYRLSRPMCHYRPSYGDYVLGWDSRHLRHANDYRAYWDPAYREYYSEDDYASAAFFGGTTTTATATASASATATSTALATTGGPSYVPALASAAALALVGSGLLALRMVLRRPGGS
jgi:hypothetical protein